MTTKTRDISDLLDANGDVKSGALDNVPASDNASALTTGTLPNARLSSVPNSALANSSITINGSATSLGGSATISTDLVNDTSPQLGGDLASNGHNINIADNDKITFGADLDMQIRHNGTDSFIQDAGTGDLILKSNGTDVKIIGDNDEDIAKFTWNDGVDLYFNNSKKFETTSGGVDITGAITVNGSALAGGVSAVKTVDITSSSTYTPTAGTKFVTVYATGGGAGAGGINQSTTVYYAYGSGGAGGAGGTGIRTYDATQLGANASITIGAGGSGGSGNATGSNGGTTTFDPAGTGTTITAYGGGGGRGIAIAHGTLSGMFGSGGGTSGAQVQIIGECGNSSDLNTASGSTVNTQANTGGASFWGGHNSTRTANGNQDHGQDASSHGAGGNGAVTKGASGSKNGGSGKAGLVVIMEYA